MNAAKHAISRCQLITRNFSSTKLLTKDMAAFKEKQRMMQIDDGVPVHLKKGASDRVIFGLVVLGMGVLGCWSASTLYTMVYPPPNK